MDDCPDYSIWCLNRRATPGTPGVIVAPIARTLSAASCRDSLHTSLGNNNKTGLGRGVILASGACASGRPVGCHNSTSWLFVLGVGDLVFSVCCRKIPPCYGRYCRRQLQRPQRKEGIRVLLCKIPTEGR